MDNLKLTPKGRRQQAWFLFFLPVGFLLLIGGFVAQIIVFVFSPGDVWSLMAFVSMLVGIIILMGASIIFVKMKEEVP